MKATAIAFVVIAVFTSIAVFVLQKKFTHTPDVALASGAPVSDRAMNAENDSESAETIDMWRARIRDVGSDAAYKEFGTSVKGLTPAMQHQRAHLFGTALYKEKGDSGFPACGSLYSFGCAHALVASAIQVKGVGAVAGFAAACKETSWPVMCTHGIGHGLIRAIGYTEESVKRAMSLCMDSVQDRSTAGCVGGVVMEYDGQSMIGGSDERRSPTVSTRYEPCASSLGEAKSACYFWLVSWWYDDLYMKDSDSFKIFPQLGKYCEGLPDKEYTPQCLAGIGAMVASVSGYTAPASEAYCEVVSSDASARMYCKAYAGNILLDTPDGEKGIQTLCASTGEAYSSRCTFLAHRGVGVFD